MNPAAPRVALVTGNEPRHRGSDRGGVGPGRLHRRRVRTLARRGRDEPAARAGSPSLVRVRLAVHSGASRPRTSHGAGGEESAEAPTAGSTCSSTTAAVEVRRDRRGDDGCDEWDETLEARQRPGPGALCLGGGRSDHRPHVCAWSRRSASDRQELVGASVHRGASTCGPSRRSPAYCASKGAHGRD